VLDGDNHASHVKLAVDFFDRLAKREPWDWLNRERGIAERTLAAIESGERGEDGERVFERWHGAGWFSREILACIKEIERARERGQFEEACRASAKMAELATAVRIKRAFDPDVETGIKIRDALASRRNRANEGRREAAKPRHELWQFEANNVWSERPTLSKSAVATIIRARLNEPASIRTIRGAIRKLATPD
jgi:hypothetical protein